LLYNAIVPTDRVLINLINLTKERLPMKKLMATLLLPAALIPVIASLPTPAQAAPVQILAQGGDVSAIAEDFVSLLGQEDYSGALSSYGSSSGVSSASLQQTWQDLVALNGSFQGSTGTAIVGGSEGSQVVVVTCQFEQGMRDVVVNFVDGQIVDFAIAES
jgi:hypothetical protein